MDTDRLAEFRAAWRDEVSRRHNASVHTTEEKPQQITREPEPVPEAEPHSEPYARFNIADRQDTLNALLVPLVEEHEKAAAAGMTYNVVNDPTDAMAQLSLSEQNSKPDDHHYEAELEPSADTSESLGIGATQMELPYLSVHEFHAEDPSKPLLLAILPDEVLRTILIHVIRPTNDARTRQLTGPDYTSLERVARTCWRMRLLSAQQQVWNEVARYAYMPPQRPVGVSLNSLFAIHAYSWRNVFLFHPRVRLNGAYIASMRYLRTTQNPDNVWVNIIHSIDYFRLLRFYADGRCAMLLTSDPPAEAVHQIGAHGAVGRWRLIPDQGSQGVPSQSLGALLVLEDMRDPRLARYTLHMTLYLEQTSAGRWNRLELIDYASRNIESGEVQPFPHRHKRPCWFSRVRSYGQ